MELIQPLSDSSAESIKLYSFIESIQNRPSMYIGQKNIAGALTIIKEVYTFTNEKADWKVSTFSFLGNGFYRIQFDKSLTFPGGEGKYESINAYPLDKPVYLGIPALVALSETLEIKSSHLHLRFQKGIVVQEWLLSAENELEITFKLDGSILETIDFSLEMMKSFFKRFVRLNAGRSIHIFEKNAQTPILFQSQGLLDLFNDVSVIVELVTPIVLLAFENKPMQLKATIIFAYHNKTDTVIHSFMQQERCSLGGTHIKGFLKGLKNAFQQIQKQHNLPYQVYEKFGLIAVLQLDYPRVGWEGATKEKVGNPELRNLVATETLNQLMKQSQLLVETIHIIGRKNRS